MKREGIYLFANLFSSKGNKENVQTFTEVTATASAQPHVLRQRMKEKEMTDVLLTGGGIIPDDDMKKLNEDGVGKLFAPGTPTSEIASYISSWVKEHRPF